MTHERDSDGRGHPTVLVVGAGVTGLTAAHELVERGFKVKVVEQAIEDTGRLDCCVGGMARTQYSYVRDQEGQAGSWEEKESFRSPKIGFEVTFRSGAVDCELTEHLGVMNSALDAANREYSGTDELQMYQQYLRACQLALGGWVVAQNYVPGKIAGYNYGRPCDECLGKADNPDLTECVLDCPIARDSEPYEALVRDEIERIRQNIRHLHWLAYMILVGLRPEMAQRDRQLVTFLYDYLRKRRVDYTPRKYWEEYGIDPNELEGHFTPLRDAWWVALFELSVLPGHSVAALADQAISSALSFRQRRGSNGDKEPARKLKVMVRGRADPDFFHGSNLIASEPPKDPPQRPKQVPRLGLAGVDAKLQEYSHYEIGVQRATSVANCLATLIQQRNSRDPRVEVTPVTEQVDYEIHVQGVRCGTSDRSALGLWPSVEEPASRVAAVSFAMPKLAGEHGYRFFPGFYRHVTDTMKRIPIYDENGAHVAGRTVYDNLVPTDETAIASTRINEARKLPLRVGRSRLRSMEAVRELRQRLLGELRLSDRDMLRFDLKVFEYLTSSGARRATYEEMSWFEFLGIRGRRGAWESQFSDDFIEQLQALPVALVGMRAEHADARTYGNMVIQLMIDHTNPDRPPAKTLNAPTTEAWFTHWRRYLELRGVEFYVGELLGIDAKPSGDDVDIRMARLGMAPTRGGHVDAYSPKRREYVALQKETDNRIGKRGGQHSERGSESSTMREMMRLTRTPEPLRLPGLVAPVVSVNAKPAPQAINNQPLAGGGGAPPGAQVALASPKGAVNDWSVADYCVLAVDVETARRTCRSLPPLRDVGALLSMPLRRGRGAAAHSDLTDTEPEEGVRQDNVARAATAAGDASAPLQPFAGVQYYFRSYFKFFPGHIYYLDSPWGLTSISQTQFWPQASNAGGYLTVLSVDIGNWYNPVQRVWRARGRPQAKAAWECSKAELAEEVWRQIKTSTPNGDTYPDPAYYHVDDDLLYNARRDELPIETMARITEYALQRESPWPISVSYVQSATDEYPDQMISRTLNNGHEVMVWAARNAPSLLKQYRRRALRAGRGRGADDEVSPPVHDCATAEDSRCIEARQRIVRVLTSYARTINTDAARWVTGRSQAHLSYTNIDEPDDGLLEILIGQAWIWNLPLERVSLEWEIEPSSASARSGGMDGNKRVVRGIRDVLDRLRWIHERGVAAEKGEAPSSSFESEHHLLVAGASMTVTVTNAEAVSLFLNLVLLSAAELDEMGVEDGRLFKVPVRIANNLIGTEAAKSNAFVNARGLLEALRSTRPTKDDRYQIKIGDFRMVTWLSSRSQALELNAREVMGIVAALLGKHEVLCIIQDNDKLDGGLRKPDNRRYIDDRVRKSPGKLKRIDTVVKMRSAQKAQAEATRQAALDARKKAADQLRLLQVAPPPVTSPAVAPSETTPGTAPGSPPETPPPVASAPAPAVSDAVKIAQDRLDEAMTAAALAQTALDRATIRYATTLRNRDNSKRKLARSGLSEVMDELRLRVSEGGRWPVLIGYDGIYGHVVDAEQARVLLQSRRLASFSDLYMFEDHAGKLREVRFPYLITPKGHWKSRPGEAVGPNEQGGYTIAENKIVLAGTYMKTFTRLTTMESANESARHAVNAILRNEAGGDQVATPCDVWDPEDNELEDVAFFKRLDEDLHASQRPHFMEILELHKLPDLLFPEGGAADRGELARRAWARMTNDDLDVLPQALATALRGVGKQVVDMVRDMMALRPDRRP